MSETTSQIALGREKVAEDLRVLLSDIEQLAHLTAAASGEGVGVVRARVLDGIQTIRGKLDSARGQARTQYSQVAAQADDFVRDNPWESVGIGVGVGLLLGVLISR
ncbi:MAG: DUF883 family protein [Janthinobacterium lividum]